MIRLVLDRVAYLLKHNVTGMLMLFKLNIWKLWKYVCDFWYPLSCLACFSRSLPMNILIRHLFHCLNCIALRLQMTVDFAVDSQLIFFLLQKDRVESLLDVHQRKRKHETGENVRFFLMIITNSISTDFLLYNLLRYCFVTVEFSLKDHVIR